MNIESQQTHSQTSQKFPPFPNGQNDLSEKQRLAVEFLAAGQGYGKCADALGVDRRTIYNWRQDELFQEAVDARRKELWCRAGDRIRALLDPAIDVIEQHLKDDYDRARFRAATTLLRIASLHKSVRVE
jgi:hypothetical protein